MSSTAPTPDFPVKALSAMDARGRCPSRPAAGTGASCSARKHCAVVLKGPAHDRDFWLVDLEMAANANDGLRVRVCCGDFDSQTGAKSSSTSSARVGYRADRSGAAITRRTKTCRVITTSG